jgi:hypothetical protein
MIWILNKIFTENSFKSKLKLYKNLGKLSVSLGSPSWVGFNEGDLEIFRCKVWKILNFE